MKNPNSMRENMISNMNKTNTGKFNPKIPLVKNISSKKPENSK